jgi:hypothetical protein
MLVSWKIRKECIFGKSIFNFYYAHHKDQRGGPNAESCRGKEENKTDPLKQIETGSSNSTISGNNMSTPKKLFQNEAFMKVTLHKHHRHLV